MAKKPEAVADEPDALAGWETQPPDQIRIELAELEKQFLSIDGPLDHADRLALAGTGDPPAPANRWVALRWMNASGSARERRGRRPPAGWQGAKGPHRTTFDQDGFNRQLSPMPQDVRALWRVVWGPLPSPAGAATACRCNSTCRNTRGRSAWAVWLAWHAIARLAGNDSLALARAAIGCSAADRGPAPAPARSCGPPATRRRPHPRSAEARRPAARGRVPMVQSRRPVYRSTFANRPGPARRVNACRRLALPTSAGDRRRAKARWTDEVRLVTEYLVEACRYRITSRPRPPHSGPLPPTFWTAWKRKPTGRPRSTVDRILKTLGRAGRKIRPILILHQQAHQELKELFGLKSAPRPEAPDGPCPPALRAWVLAEPPGRAVARGEGSG